jgi:lipopolysaccharide export system permease protein
MRVRIFERYLLRELLLSLLATTFVLLLITVGGFLSDTLSKIARGKVPPDLLMAMIGLRTLEGLTLLLPLALFLAVLMTYGRLYRDSEIAVFAASGLGVSGLMRPLAMLGVPLAILLAMLSLWVAPASVRLGERLVNEANRSLILAGLDAGRFVELPGRHSVVYVAELDPEGRRFRRLFVHAEREGRVDIVTAEAGELYFDGDDGERYLSLSRGFRVEGDLSSDAFRTMRFERNDIRLPDAETEMRREPESAERTRALISQGTPRDMAELHWRIGAPLSALVLCLLALPLARSAPRQPRYGRILMAILAYIVYANGLALGRGFIGSGAIPAVLGLWWVHALVLALAIWLIWWGGRLPRVRRT